MRAVLLSGIALSLLVPGAAHAEEMVLEPSSKWHLDYAADKCRLGRTFGEGERKAVLFLEQYQPGEFFSWTIAGQPVGQLSAAREPRVQFGTLPPPEPVRGQSTIMAGQLAEFGPALIGSGHKEVPRPNDEDELKPGLPQLDIEDGSRIEWIEFARGKSRLRVETGNLRAAFAALNECTANLVTSWGLDVEQQRRRATPPRWLNNERVVREIGQTYPDKAVRRGEQANLHVRMMVSAEGVATSCVVTRMTVADSFNDQVCKVIMRNARFEPARLATGEPIASYMATSIRYIMG